MKRRLFLVLVTLGVTVPVMAQQEFTLHYLDNALPSLYVNPMAQTNHTVSAGVPGLSSIGFGFNLGGLTPRSLMTIEGTTAQLDLNRFVKKLNNVNFITAGASVDIFSAQATVRDNSYSLSFRSIVDARVRYPKGIFSIITDGILDEPQFKKIGAQLNAYHELGLGFSHHDEHSKLQYGGRFKLLFGVANAELNANLSIDVNEDDIYQWDMAMDAELNAASLLLDDESDNFSPMKLALGGNTGMGIDAGATYKWDEKITFAASIVDLGFIRWKTNPINMSTNASYQWEGVSISASDYNSIDSLSNGISNVTDEIAEEFEDMIDFDSTNNSYTTGLFTKLYLTTHYQLLPKTRLSGTIYAEFNKGMRSGWILAGTQDLGVNFKLAVDYWRWRNSGGNLGFGFVWDFGPFQYHMMFDNIWVGQVLKVDADSISSGSSSGESIPVPYNFRNFNMRFGFALMFGRIRESVKQSNTSLR